MLYGLKHQTFNQVKNVPLLETINNFRITAHEKCQKELKIFFTTIDISHNYKENKYIMYVQQQSKI